MLGQMTHSVNKFFIFVYLHEGIFRLNKTNFTSFVNKIITDYSSFLLGVKLDFPSNMQTTFTLKTVHDLLLFSMGKFNSEKLAHLAFTLPVKIVNCTTEMNW